MAALRSTPNEHGLSLERHRGIGTDNASAITGANNCVHQKPEAIARINLFYLPLSAVNHLGCYGSDIADKYGVPNKRDVGQRTCLQSRPRGNSSTK